MVIYLILWLCSRRHSTAWSARPTSTTLPAWRKAQSKPFIFKLFWKHSILVSSFFVKAVSSALDISGQKQLTDTKASIWVALTTLLQAHVNGRKHKMAIQKLEFNGKNWGSFYFLTGNNRNIANWALERYLACKMQNQQSVGLVGAKRVKS